MCNLYCTDMRWHAIPQTVIPFAVRLPINQNKVFFSFKPPVPQAHDTGCSTTLDVWPLIGIPHWCFSDELLYYSMAADYCYRFKAKFRPPDLFWFVPNRVNTALFYLSHPEISETDVSQWSDDMQSPFHADFFQLYLGPASTASVEVGRCLVGSLFNTTSVHCNQQPSPSAISNDICTSEDVTTTQRSSRWV
jgi:hypothetical protein